MSLGIEEALLLIQYAFKQRTEELLFQRWIHDIHLSMSFDEFKASLKHKSRPTKSEKEILDDVKDILAMTER